MISYKMLLGLVEFLERIKCLKMLMMLAKTQEQFTAGY